MSKPKPPRNWRIELFDITPGYGASAVQYCTSERRPTKKEFEDDWMNVLNVSPGPLEQASYFKHKIRCKVAAVTTPAKWVLDTQNRFTPIGSGKLQPKAENIKTYDPFDL